MYNYDVEYGVQKNGQEFKKKKKEKNWSAYKNWPNPAGLAVYNNNMFFGWVWGEKIVLFSSTQPVFITMIIKMVADNFLSLHHYTRNALDSVGRPKKKNNDRIEL